MEHRKELEHFLIKIKHHIPHNNILALIMTILKILPILIITHDWNILYTHCFSYYLSLITLSSTLHQKENKTLRLIIMIVIILITIAIFIVMLIFYKRMKSFGKIKGTTFFTVMCFIFYYLNFFFSQYIFMLCGTNFVCFQQYDTSKEYHYIKEYKDDCRSIDNIILIVIQIFLIIYLKRMV